jgi:tRNA threonylcarbamoyladenosine biosynthesis protein TsaB
MNEPLILSIESSGARCEVALSESEKIRSIKFINEVNMHDKMLGELIRKILMENKLQVSDLDAVAVSAGPGSFTGLRIGAAISKGLCFDNNPVLISVPTLESLAFAAKGEAKEIGLERIVSIIRSHNNYGWYQKFSVDVVAMSKVYYSDINEMNLDEDVPVLFCGPGALELEKDYISKTTIDLSARYIAVYGSKLFFESKFSSVDEFVPEYHNVFVPKKVTRK